MAYLLSFLICTVVYKDERTNSEKVSIILGQLGSPSNLFILLLPIVICRYFTNILKTPQEIKQRVKFVNKSSY